MYQNFGRCPCSGRYENRLVEVRITLEDRNVVLNDVVQGACLLCGSRVYKATTLALVECVMRNCSEFTHPNLSSAT